jgi:hypothetical protein
MLGHAVDRLDNRRVDKRSRESGKKRALLVALPGEADGWLWEEALPVDMRLAPFDVRVESCNPQPSDCGRAVYLE